MTTGQRITTFLFEYVSIYKVGAVAFSPDGKTLAVGYSDNKVRLWDVTAATETAVPKKWRGGSGWSS